jgi:hypothetical protein
LDLAIQWEQALVLDISHINSLTLCLPDCIIHSR